LIFFMLIQASNQLQFFLLDFILSLTNKFTYNYHNQGST